LAVHSLNKLHHAWTLLPLAPPCTTLRPPSYCPDRRHCTTDDLDIHHPILVGNSYARNVRAEVQGPVPPFFTYEDTQSRVCAPRCRCSLEASSVHARQPSYAQVGRIPKKVPTGKAGSKGNGSQPMYGRITGKKDSPFLPDRTHHLWRPRCLMPQPFYRPRAALPAARPPPL